MNALLGYALTSDEATPGWGWLMKNTRLEMTDQEFKWTVFYKDPTTQSLSREHFVNKTGKGGAVERCNALLRKGYKAWIREYRPPRRYVDIVAERGPNG